MYELIVLFSEDEIVRTSTDYLELVTVIMLG